MKYKVMDGPTEGTDIEYKETPIGFTLITKRPHTYTTTQSADLFDCMSKDQRARVLYERGYFEESAKLQAEHQAETTIELVHSKFGEFTEKT